MIRKLQLKFVVINMTMVTIMLCVIFGLVYQFTRSNLESESIRMMETIASDPLRLGRPSDGSSDLHLPYFTLQVSLNGELVSTGGGYYDLSDQAFLRDLIAESARRPRDVGVLEEHGLRYCRVSTPIGMVLVFSDMSSETNVLRSLVRTSLVIGVFSFLVFLGISIFLSRWAVRPVAAAWKQQQQFVADASHELKTPLTVIMTNAELLQSEGFSEAERSRFSSNILVMSRQMKQLVQKMLEIARADSQQAAQPPAAVDWSRLVLDAALSFEGVFVEKNLALESRVDPDIQVRGDGQALREVVDILLDNAQKYSAPGGTTEIRLCRSGRNRCRLSVSNPGEPLSQEALKNIFRRFYRMDQARSRDGSFGLGLAIASAIVEQHRGRIWAESRDGRNTFFVELPGHA